MSFLKNIFGSKKLPKYSVNININVTTFFFANTKPSENFDSKERSGAIECLRSAYKIMVDSPEWFDPAAACRLLIY